MLSLVKNTASVTRFIRNLRGNSQPILAEASDGFLYVLKFANNLQGPNVVFNEGAGSELYRAFDLAIPVWQPLLLTDSFILQNPDCWMQTPTGSLPPIPGLCFGSRFLGGGGVRLLEILPGSYFNRVENAGDFWLAWLLDICAEHADNRQAIFREAADGRLHAVFIDHEHMFGGPKGEQNRPPRTSRYLDARIYSRLTEPLIAQLRTAAASLDADQLWRKVNALPDEWKTDSALQRLETCVERLASEAFVESALNSMASSFGFQCTYEKCDIPCVRRPRVRALRPEAPLAAGIRSIFA